MDKFFPTCVYSSEYEQQMARTRVFMTDDVLEVMRQSDEPFITVGEITKQVDVTKKTVHDRLQELVDEGEVHRKKVGARAVIWWLPERYPVEPSSD